MFSPPFKGGVGGGNNLVANALGDGDLVFGGDKHGAASGRKNR